MKFTTDDQVSREVKELRLTGGTSQSQDGDITIVTVDGAGGGLPTGWTADDPATGNLNIDNGAVFSDSTLRVLDADENTRTIYYASNAPDNAAIQTQDVGDLDYSVGFYNGASAVFFWASDTDIIRANKQILANNGLKLGDDLDADQCNLTNFAQLQPHLKPNIPASPTVQDVVDALLTLGLVTQG